MELQSGFPRHLHESKLIDYKDSEKYSKSNNYNAYNQIINDKIISEKEIIFQAFLFTGNSVIDLTYFDIHEIDHEQDFHFNREHLIVPLKLVSDTLYIVTFNPFDFEFFENELIKKYPHKKLKILISDKKGILNLNSKIEISIENKNLNIKSKSENNEKQEIMTQSEATKEKDLNMESDNHDKNEKEDLKSLTISNFLKQVLTSSINANADEIHFEPYNQSYRVRFKQNNELYIAFQQPKEIGEDIACKIKEMANLDVTAKRPQSGHLTIKISGSKSVDFKVSVCPLYVGDKIVFNVKHNNIDKLNFDSLGFETEDVIKLNKSLQSQDGVFIFNGKKQSGRKHSMYSVLKKLNSKKLNIYTIENNVGFYLDGINQIKTGKDFSYIEALDVISEQNADVIMLDVVQDVGVLKKLFQLAKTGRMILFKTNLKNTKEVMQFLLQSEISLLDIYTSLKLIISQALLSENCHHCEKEDLNISPTILREFNFNKSDIEDFDKLWKPIHSEGCLECENRGVSGLISIFDIFVISKEMRQLILNGQLKTFVDMIDNIDENILYNKAKIKFKDGLINFEQLKEIFY